MTPTRYLRLVRTSAWYDLVVTAGFATPWTYRLLHEALSLGGAPSGNPAGNPADTLTVLYANLMASVVIVWSLLRILRPLPLHGLLDGVARVLFASWQAYALVQGAAAVVWLFLSVEVAFGVAQLTPWARRNPRRNPWRSPWRNPSARPPQTP